MNLTSWGKMKGCDCNFNFYLNRLQKVVGSHTHSSMHHK